MSAADPISIAPRAIDPRPLKEQSQAFHQHLLAVKRDTPLHPKLSWYPWPSLGQFDILDDLLKGDMRELMRMIGPDPVLDVGCGDGDVAFFLESLGARVDVVDNAPTNYNAMYGVRALKEHMPSSIGIHALDVDSGAALPPGPYGFTVMLGILYHLKNPFLVLETLARQSRYIFLSTRIAEFAPDRKTSFANNPVAYLVDTDELNHDYTNYWIFTGAGLKRIVQRAGWDILHYSVAGPPLHSDPVSPEGDARAFLIAKSRLATPLGDFRRTTGWHEVENSAWQWSAANFGAEASLSEPRGPSKLHFRFFLPDPVFDAIPEITLSARVTTDENSEGLQLPPVSYTTPGPQEYTANLPPLAAGILKVEFSLSHAIAPSSTDSRELGMQVNLTGNPPLQLL
ncbi:MAG: methyltransferase domain-containing protein [Acidobacteriota bacterium]